MQNRIRALRKERGWTLSDLAARITPDPPTAQTIARLETGTRTLSLPWLEKIAAALEVDPQALLTLSDGPSSPILGSVGPAGITAGKTPPEIDLSVLAKDPVALDFETPRGRFQAGDLVIFDKAQPYSGGILDEGLVLSEDGRLLFGSIFPGADDGQLLIATPAPHAGLHDISGCQWSASAVCVIRRLGQD
ncbi:MAG: helix-turn-helix transcriptional regulator [Pseudomonadota bacterium]